MKIKTRSATIIISDPESILIFSSPEEVPGELIFENGRYIQEYQIFIETIDLGEIILKDTFEVLVDIYDQLDKATIKR